ncbi:MAG TPA: SLC13 family permease [Bacteroidia bacterium]|nr:SLC13 family permease [Bacteroidia bacterium]HNP97453.1 SLC13 family permease [Bacteroidia bacterium]
MEIAIVLGLLVLAILLFSMEKFSVDLVTMGLLFVLIATKIITPQEAFAGFGSDFMVVLTSIFIISGALQQTGVLDLIGARLLSLAKARPEYMIVYIMFAVGLTSAFMNNTTVTAIFLAPVIAVARNLKMGPSKLLIPVAYASILGGTCTLIGTSTNIAVGGYLEKIGMQPIGMFEFLPVGLALFVTGLLYMALVGKRSLPDNKDESMEAEFGLRAYVSEIVISQDSPLIGKGIFQSSLSKMGFRILNVIRLGHNFLPDKTSIIEANDILIVEGKLENLIAVKETEGIDIRADGLLDYSLQSENIKLAEVLVTPQSEFLNNTLKSSNFRQKYGLVVLAINRSGHTLREKLGKVILRVGDILLVQGPIEKIDYYKLSRDIAILDDFRPLLYKRRKGILTLAVFITSIILGSCNIFPLSASMILGVLVVVLIKAVSIERAYETIDWKLLVMIGGMSAFGTAMTNSGAATWLSQNIVNVMQPFGTLAIMAGFVILTVFLTQPMSNAAAALVVLPIAIETARHLEVNPRTFAIAVMLSASVSLVTPFEPSCILVYGPGKYRFIDFFKAGGILTVILMAVLMILIPYYWPL